MKPAERPAAFEPTKDLLYFYNPLRTKFQSFFRAKVLICFPFQFIQPVRYLDGTVFICMFAFRCIRTASAVLTPVIIPSGFVPGFCYIFAVSCMYQLLFIAADKAVCFWYIGQVVSQIGILPVFLFLLPVKLVIFYITSQILSFQIFVIFLTSIAGIRNKVFRQSSQPFFQMI